jgi:hypothetical protein
MFRTLRPLAHTVDRPQGLDDLGTHTGRPAAPGCRARCQLPGDRPDRHPLATMKTTDLRPVLHVQHLPIIRRWSVSPVATGSVFNRRRHPARVVGWSGREVGR